MRYTRPEWTAVALALTWQAAVSIDTTARGDGPPLAIPPVAASAAADRLVAEVYGADLARARTPDAKLALADRMVRSAADEKSDVAGKYQTYEKARDLAVAAEDLAAADRVIDAEARDFAIDPVRLKLEAARTLARTLHAPGARTAFVDEVLATSNQAAAADNYDAAASADATASTAAQAAHDGRLLSAVQAHTAWTAEARADYLQARAAAIVLAAAPDDPTANLTVGRYLCLTKGQWATGLPLLARGSDPALRGGAEAELQAGSDGSLIAVAADLWWDATATMAQSTEACRAAVRAHAGALYTAALPSLAGLTRAKAETRVAEASAATAARADPTRAAGTLDLLGTPGLVKSSGRVIRVGRGYQLGPDGSVVGTVKAVPVPCRITAVVKTDSRNIRFSYGDREWIIFDWELDNDQLRLLDLATGQINGIKGKGAIPPGHYARVEITATADSVVVAVDGQVRGTTKGNYAKLSAPVKVSTPGGSVLTLREFTVAAIR